MEGRREREVETGGRGWVERGGGEREEEREREREGGRECGKREGGVFTRAF